jgi:hypothetical protein
MGNVENGFCFEITNRKMIAAYQRRIEWELGDDALNQSKEIF